MISAVEEATSLYQQDCILTKGSGIKFSIWLDVPTKRILRKSFLPCTLLIAKFVAFNIFAAGV